MLGRKRPDLDIAQPHVDLLPKAGPEELGSRSKLAHQLLTGKPIVSIELSPPTGVDMSKSIELFKLLEDANISFVNVPDGPRATARMSNMAFCKLVLEHSSLEPILHVCARDHNLLALQGTLLGAHALGIRNTVMITGDPPKVGDYPDASAVFDVDSIGLLSMANRLNHGVDPGGKPIRGRTNSILMTGAEPHAANLDKEIARLAEKIHAGAEAIMTQPVYDSAIFEKFLRAVETFRIPILMGLLPLASAKNAWFLHRNVPGMQIPELILKRMSDAQTAEEAQEVGIDISVQALNQLRSSIQGVYLMPPLGRVSACIEVVRRAGL
jgi:homocysteine S-methyltransferase